MPGPRKSPVSGLPRPHYRNGSFTQEEEEPDLASDTECDSSVYDSSLPPGKLIHVFLSISSRIYNTTVIKLLVGRGFTPLNFNINEHK